MELLYNPDQMPESEIKATFVAREKLVDDLLALVVTASPMALARSTWSSSHRAAWARRPCSS